jgi:poly(A) polymerase
MQELTDETAVVETPELALVPEAQIVSRSEHCVSRKAVPENVLKVLYRLHRSGYRSYLCGGSVRDLLMGRTPKDFDIATSAQPAEIRRLFRNSRIIGRRFRLVHILFQQDVVEVSTFRKEPEHRPDSGDLLVTDDNTFGTPMEDARRRDFTVNGLFYDISDFSIIDYVGGLEDLERKLIRVIGDPDIRFREDPVRMMRAVEFAARLGFSIETRTLEGIRGHRSEILKASPARVSEELFDLLRRGCSASALRIMLDSGLLEPLLPELHALLIEDRTPYFWTMLEVLDRTARSGRRVSDAVLFSVVILPYVMEQIDREEARRGGRLRTGEALLLIRELIQPICARMTFAAGTRHRIEQAIETLWRLIEPPGERRSAWRFAFREPFIDGMALLELYALSSKKYVGSFQAWKKIGQRVHSGGPEEAAPVSAAPRPRRRRRRRPPQPS